MANFEGFDGLLFKFQVRSNSLSVPKTLQINRRSTTVITTQDLKGTILLVSGLMCEWLEHSLENYAVKPTVTATDQQAQH
jgi:hypothetical protein